MRVVQTLMAAQVITGGNGMNGNNNNNGGNGNGNGTRREMLPAIPVTTTMDMEPPIVTRPASVHKPTACASAADEEIGNRKVRETHEKTDKRTKRA